MSDDNPTPADLIDALDAQIAQAARKILGDGATASVNAIRQAIAPARERAAEAARRMETEARLGRLALTLADLFGRAHGTSAACAAALDAIAPLVRASRAWAVMIDGDEARLLAEKREAEGGLPPGDDPLVSRGLLQRLVRERRAVLVGDASRASEGGETSIVRMGVRSVLVVPLQRENRVFGALGVESTTLLAAFTDDDRELLERIAVLLAPYVHVSARLDDAVTQVEQLQASGARVPPDTLVGASRAMTALSALIDKVADADAPVLIEGESGTGKELVARALHARSRRKTAPFVAVNCAAIPEGLLESELFGHERGAFTGATDMKKGRFEQADGGTLFLDEIGEMRPELQAKLLRVLQDQTFERVGGSAPRRVNVRVVAATHRDIKKLVAEGRFREDLFYRIHVVPIAVPPLRERPEDIPVLARHFLDEASRSLGRALAFEPEVLLALQRHSFPGNVRELKNLVLRIAVLADGARIGLGDLPEEIAGARTATLDKDPFRRFARAEIATADELKRIQDEMQATFATYVRAVEARFYKGLVERAGGNVSEAARAGGVNRTFLHKKLKDISEST